MICKIGVEEAAMIDLLSDIFDTIRLRGTLYFRTDYHPPWAITVPREAMAVRFHLVIQGNCHLSMSSGARVDLGPGDLVLVLRGQEHDLADAPGRKPASLESVMLESGYDGGGVFALGSASQVASTQMVCGHFTFADGADHPLLRSLPDFLVMTPADRARHPILDDTLRLVVRRVFSPGLGAATAIARLSEVFFIEVIRASVEKVPELARRMQAMTDPQIGQALELIHQNSSKAWTVESLAQHVGMSRSRFAERFKELTGDGPLGYLTEWRLQQALALLNLPHTRVQEVAHKIGYQSPAAFTRAFANKFGVSPSDYRLAER